MYQKHLFNNLRGPFGVNLILEDDMESTPDWRSSDPGERGDQIITYRITFEYGNGNTIIIERTKVVDNEGLNYKGEDGKYYYYDEYKTVPIFVQVEKGIWFEGTTHYNTGKYKGTSEYDLSTWTGRLNHMLFEKLFKSNSSEGYRDGGGIMFTSGEGRGGAPISKYVDGQPENIDALIAALSVSSTALGQERILFLTDKLEYIAKAISMYNDLQGAGKQPFTIDIDEMARYKSTSQNPEEKLIKKPKNIAKKKIVDQDVYKGEVKYPHGSSWWISKESNVKKAINANDPDTNIIEHYIKPKNIK